MTVAETVIQKILSLPEEKQRVVLEFIKELEHTLAAQRELLIDPYGTCADLRSDLSFEEFQQNRREMWGSSADKEVGWQES